jgi:replicative DNA helicase
MKDEFLKSVDEGLLGRNKGILTGMPRLSSFLNNIQKKRYFLVGAQQKTGKTAFIDDFFILSPYLLNPNVNIHWKYFSYEIDKTSKKSKWTAYIMKKIYGIDKGEDGGSIEDAYILSLGDRKLGAKHRLLIDEINTKYLEPLFSKIEFFEEREGPTGIYKHMMNHAASVGEIIYEDYQQKETDDYGKFTGNTITKQRIAGFKNKTDITTIFIVDHVGLMRLERGFTKKQNIDKLSDYSVILRNLFEFIPVLVSQFNRELSKVDRLKFSGEELQPSIEDFKDTGCMSEDASVVIALFNPTLFPHIKNHLGYDLKKIGNGYRSLHILANRHGITGANISLNLEGNTGICTELPKIN